MKVLVVDDEPDVIEVINLCFSLRWPEAQVIAAENAEQALTLVEQQQPDLILLDIMLPDRDGFHVCQEVRRFSDVPIVMLTARDGEVDKVRGLEMGADDYITKPFSPREVVARVRAVLRRGTREAVELVRAGDLVIELDDFVSAVIHQHGRKRRLRWRGQEKGHAAEIAAFVKAAREGGSPPIPFESLSRTTRATFAAAESLRTGKPVNF